MWESFRIWLSDTWVECIVWSVIASLLAWAVWSEFGCAAGD